MNGDGFVLRSIISRVRLFSIPLGRRIVFGLKSVKLNALVALHGKLAIHIGILVIVS